VSARRKLDEIRQVVFRSDGVSIRDDDEIRSRKEISKNAIETHTDKRSDWLINLEDVCVCVCEGWVERGIGENCVKLILIKINVFHSCYCRHHSFRSL